MRFQYGWPTLIVWVCALAIAPLASAEQPTTKPASTQPSSDYVGRWEAKSTGGQVQDKMILSINEDRTWSTESTHVASQTPNAEVGHREVAKGKWKEGQGKAIKIEMPTGTAAKEGEFLILENGELRGTFDGRVLPYTFKRLP